MRTKKFLAVLLSIVNLGLGSCLTTSAVRVFSDNEGNRFETSGQGPFILSINTKEAPLTENMFDEIAKQAKEDKYKHILLENDVILDQGAAKKLALNFLAVSLDSYYIPAYNLCKNDRLFKDGASVLDVKKFVAEKIQSNICQFLFAKDYLILPVDNLISSLVIDVYARGNCYDENGQDNGKFLECREYYIMCGENLLKELKNNETSVK